MRNRLAILLVTGLAATAACTGDGGLLDVREDPLDLFWSLKLNQTAINLSLDESQPAYHTFQLAATPTKLDGTPFAAEGLTPEFVSSDTNRVSVSADGLVRAKATTPASRPVMVIAKMTGGRGPVTNADTAYIVVTEDVRPIESFSIQPLRTEYGIGYDTTMAARAIGPDGEPVTGIRVDYSSSVAKIAAYTADGVFQPMNMGTVMLRASTMNYGTAFADSVQLTVTDPEVFVVINNGEVVDGVVTLMFDPAVLTIKAGQGVAWMPGNFGCVYGIEFDDPDPVGASPMDGATGNIPFFCGVGTRAIRMFPNPGTYTYSGGAIFGFPTVGETKIIVEP